MSAGSRRPMHARPSERRQPSRTTGFTLLELIVVIAIFGVMSAMAYGGLNSVLQTRARVEQSLARTAELQKAYMRLRNDLQQVRNRPARDSYGDLKAAFSGDRATGRLDFTRGGWRNPLSAPRASLERVGYYLNQKDKTFMRASFRVLDQAQDSKAADIVLVNQVQDARWRYLDPATREWRTSWPPQTVTGAAAATAYPPLAVELTLTTSDYGELRYLFRLGLDPLPRGFTPGVVPAATGPGQGPAATGGNASATPAEPAKEAP